MLNTSHFGSLRQIRERVQVHKYLNTYYRLIVGIRANVDIKDSEIKLHSAWIVSVSKLWLKALYNKFVSKINVILCDGEAIIEKVQDLFCKNPLDNNKNSYYCVITPSTHQLGGFWLRFRQTKQSRASLRMYYNSYVNPNSHFLDYRFLTKEL